MLNLIRYIFLWSISIFLSNCMDLATSGAQAIYNRHSIQRNLDDERITILAYQSLNQKTTEFRNTNISISTYHKEVLLTGQVPFAWQKEKAETIIKRIPDVKAVYNLITIAGTSSALTTVSDTWITTKVKAQLIASNDLDATQVKVVTENGTVYLMGFLLPDEADAAANVASETDGVQRVVKLFSYIHLTKKETV